MLKPVQNILVVFFAILMAISLVAYGSTFLSLEFNNEFLEASDAVLGTLSWLIILACMGVGLVLGVVTKRFRWSIKSCADWMQRLCALGFIVTIMILIGTTAGLHHTTIRLEGVITECDVNGKLISVPKQAFVDAWKQNARLYLAFINCGFFLWMGFVAGILQEMGSNQRGKITSNVE
jgi:hypothetical protein